MTLRPYILVIVIYSCSSKPGISKHDAKKSNELTQQSKAFLDNNQLDSAEVYLSEALKFDPENYAAFNNRAILKFKLNKPNDAIVKDFNKSIEINPHYDVALASLANYYFEIKDYVNTVKACNNFISHSRKTQIDKSQIEHIYAIKETAQNYTRIVDGTAVFRAISYYDSINLAIKETSEITQTFINKIAAIVKDNSKYKGAVTYFDLGRLLDSANLHLKRRINNIKKISEVDSKINYRQKVLDHAMLLNSLLENEFKDYLHGKEYMGVLGINKMSRVIVPKLRQIKEAELKMLTAREEFKLKYGFTSPSKKV
jgi:Tfp pilus assembly protein PilF